MIGADPAASDASLANLGANSSAGAGPASLIHGSSAGHAGTIAVVAERSSPRRRAGTTEASRQSERVCNRSALTVEAIVGIGTLSGWIRYLGSQDAPARDLRNGALPGEDDPCFIGKDDCLHAIAQSELHQYPSDVSLDGRLADEQLGCYLGVG